MDSHDWNAYIQGLSSGALANNPATMAVNTGGNLWNLLKAGVGVAGKESGLLSSDQMPEMTDMAQVPLSSEWLRNKVEDDPSSKSGFWGNITGGLANPASIVGAARKGSQMIAGSLAKNAPPRSQMTVGEDMVPKWEFSDQLANLKRTLKPGEEMPLSSILNHDELYKNYPMVGRNVQVKTYPADTAAAKEFIDAKAVGGDYVHKGAMGWDQDTNKATIYLNPNVPPEQQRETILHEIQHYVQHIEGMSDIANTKGLSALKADVMDWLGKYQALKTQDPRKAGEFAASIKEKYGVPESMLDPANEAGKAGKHQLSGQVYWWQPAEKEARLTQARRDMSDLQRSQEPFHQVDTGPRLDWEAVKKEQF